MEAAALQQAIVARIREAQAITESECLDIAATDGLRLADLVDGIDERAADVLAWVARSPVLFDAIAQVAQVHRLREQVEARKAGAR